MKSELDSLHNSIAILELENARLAEQATKLQDRLQAVESQRDSLLNLLDYAVCKDHSLERDRECPICIAIKNAAAHAVDEKGKQ